MLKHVRPVIYLLASATVFGSPALAQVKKATAKTAAAPAAKTVTPNGTVLVQTVNAQPGKLTIPFKKFKLKNGLTLVVTEDHSDPIARVDVTYHVGSAREEVGKSGFAHFFEHMMFQGSEHVADEEHIKTVTGAGGTMNGTTNTDRTNYFETVPNNQLETALWLEADRMGYLLPAVTQQKFEIQRATVKNERGQNYDNRPYGLAGETINRALYPYGHPYSWLTIGYIEDLNRVDVNDLKNFFLRWYGPNNAVVTVGGDVNTDEVVKLVEKYFGNIPTGPAVKKASIPMPVLEKDRYVSLEDNIRIPLLQVVFPSVPNYHPDEAPLDALAEILGGGENSIFYKNFVKSRKALRAYVSNPCTELGGEFVAGVMPTPGNTLPEMQKMVYDAFAEFEKRGVTDEDLERFKANYESQILGSLSEVDGKVSMLAAAETFRGNPDQVQKDLAIHAKVTKADVMRVYNQYVKGKHAVILSVVPKGKPEMKAAADNFEVDKSKYTQPADQYKGLTYKHPVDQFDRAVKPKSGANPVIKVPNFTKTTFDNGVTMMATRNSELPVFGMLITIKGGHINETPAKDGLASFTANLMNESSAKRSTEEIANELQKLGAEISISTGLYKTNVYVQGRVKNIDRTMAIVQERLFTPGFTEEDFQMVKQQTLESIKNRPTQATALASLAYDKLLYGNSVRALPNGGTTASVESITLDDVKAWYKNHFGPKGANVVVVGDVDDATVKAKTAWLAKWAGESSQDVGETAYPAAAATKIYLIDKEGAAQSEIRMGYVSLPFDATGEYYKARIMNYLLGGAFNSRINIKLREEKGYTYGARSGFGGSKFKGPFTVSTGVRTDVTDSAVVDLVEVLKTYRNNTISDADLAFIKSSMGQAEALKYESLEQKADFLSQILEYNLPANFVQEQSAILAKFTKEDVKAYADKYVPLTNMYIVVVGDKAKVEKGLKATGFEVVELTKEGDPVPVAAPAPPATPEPAPAPETGKKGKKKK